MCRKTFATPSLSVVSIKSAKTFSPFLRNLFHLEVLEICSTWDQGIDVVDVHILTKATVNWSRNWVCFPLNRKHFAFVLHLLSTSETCNATVCILMCLRFYILTLLTRHAISNNFVPFYQHFINPNLSMQPCRVSKVAYISNFLGVFLFWAGCTCVVTLLFQQISDSVHLKFSLDIHAIWKYVSCATSRRKFYFY